MDTTTPILWDQIDRNFLIYGKEDLETSYP